MGVIVRQSFWTSLFTYLGVVLGYITTLILFPKYFDLEQIGLIRLIQSNGIMFVPLVTAGMPNTLVKYFPELQQKESLKSDFISWQLIIITGTTVLFLLLCGIFLGSIQNLFAAESNSYNAYLYVSIIILIAQSFFEYFNGYCRANLNIILPNYFREVHLRLVNILLVIAFGFSILTFEQTILFLWLNYVSASFLLGLIAYWRYRFKITFPKRLPKDWGSNIRSFGIYALLMSVGASIMANIGFLLTSSFLGLDKNGLFTTFVYISVIAEMPKRASAQIITPLFSNLFSANDKEGIRHLYQRSSVNLFLVGVLLAIGIITNLHDLFDLIPKGDQFRSGFWAIVILVSTRLINMSSGTSAELLFFSPLKNYNLYLLLGTSILAIILNVLLIPLWGVNGAALAMGATFSVAALTRFIIAYRHFRLSPFTKDYPKILILGVVTFLLFSYLDLTLPPILMVVVRSLATAIFFLGIAYWLKVSAEFNGLVNKWGKRIFGNRFS